MLATSEAMLLGTVHGLSPQILAHIINTSTGKCWSSEVVSIAVQLNNLTTLTKSCPPEQPSTGRIARHRQESTSRT